ncbi:MAG: antitoxin [Campylobacterota bacterium]|nr:antitoxin [Campylobacterota bacterium]
MKKSIESSEELQIIKDVEDGKYVSLEGNEQAEMKSMLAEASRNTIEKLTKKKAINIRLLESDIEKLKAMALYEGLPYQTYISHIIHKLTTGALKAV